jgi:hypothetical protein
VHADRADRVVDPDPVDEDDRDDHQQPGEGADDDGHQARHRVRAGGDADQPGEHAVGDHRDVPRAGPQADEQPGGGAAGATGQRRGHDHDPDRLGVELEDRAAVEAEPAEEQQQGAERHERDRVAGDRPRLAGAGVELADPGPEDGGGHERRDAAGHVHDGGAGEVLEAELGDPAATPGPRADHRVDQGGHHGRDDDVGTELHPLGDGAGHDRRRGGGEHRLEGEVDLQRVAGLGHVVRGGGEEEAVGAEQPRGLGAVHQAPPDRVVGQHPDRDGHEVLADDVRDVLAAGQPGLEHREAGVHDEHQHGREHQVQHGGGDDQVVDAHPVLCVGGSGQQHERRRHPPDLEGSLHVTVLPDVLVAEVERRRLGKLTRGSATVTDRYGRGRYGRAISLPLIVGFGRVSSFQEVAGCRSGSRWDSSPPASATSTATSRRCSRPGARRPRSARTWSCSPS